jgi:hypothetical protein
MSVAQIGKLRAVVQAADKTAEGLAYVEVRELTAVNCIAVVAEADAAVVVVVVVAAAGIAAAEVAASVAYAEHVAESAVPVSGHAQEVLEAR